MSQQPTYDAVMEKYAALEAENARLKAAIRPSAHTRLAYQHSISIERDGYTYPAKINARQVDQFLTRICQEAGIDPEEGRQCLAQSTK